MNLHALVAPLIGAVNPNIVDAVCSQSTGYTTSPSGKRVPTYNNFAFDCQAQSLTFQDLAHLDGQNIQGVRRAIYLSGAIFAIVRVAQKGGDIITFRDGTFPEGNVWLAAYVLEAWSQSGWVKVCLTLQVDES
jgi:hypothetical protein